MKRLLLRLAEMGEKVFEDPKALVVLNIIVDLLQNPRGLVGETSEISDQEPSMVRYEIETMEGKKTMRAKFAKWARRLADEAGVKLSEDGLAKLATLWGELSQTEFALVVARGEEIPWWYTKFDDVDGLGSCMTKASKQTQFHALIPSLSLYVALANGKPLARALVWEDVINDEDGLTYHLVAMDRIYYSSMAAGEWLQNLAKERDMIYRPLGKGYVEFDEDGFPDEPPFRGWRFSGYRYYVRTGVMQRDLYFPYMDTFAFATYEGDGWVLATYPRKVKDRVYQLRRTDGTLGLYKREEPEGPLCVLCGLPAQDQDLVCQDCRELMQDAQVSLEEVLA